MCHLIIVEVRQRDQGRATYAANDNDLTNLAHQVVTLDRKELATLCLLEQGNGKLEQIVEWAGTGRTATHSLEAFTGRTYARQVPLWNLSNVKKSDQFTQRLGPSGLGVANPNHGVGIVHRITDHRKLVHVLPLHREAHTRTTHQDIHTLVERTGVVHRDVRTVVAADVVTG